MTTETTNGRARGRAAPPPPAITFSTGYTVRVQRLPPMTQQRVAEAVQRMDVVRGITRPRVPQVITELGTEANPADPDYLAALARFDGVVALEFNDRLLTLVCLDAVEVDWTDAIRTLVARTRRRLIKVGAWQDDPDLEPDEADRLLFIQHIAARTSGDLQALYRAVAALSEPTPEVVEQHMESFPDRASGT